MKAIHVIAFVLLVIGGLNWGLVAFGYNVVDMIFGAGSTLAMIVYLLVGVSALFEAVTHKWNCKHCVKSSDATPSPMMGSSM
jgi:uncharacterized membrane protein YuzA (DUF378 family)